MPIPKNTPFIPLHKYIRYLFLITAIEGLIIALIVLFSNTNSSLAKNLNMLLVIGTLTITGLLSYLSYLSFIDQSFNQLAVDKVKRLNKKAPWLFHSWVMIVLLIIAIIALPFSSPVYKLFHKRLIFHFIWLLLLLLQAFPLIIKKEVIKPLIEQYIHTTRKVYKTTSMKFNKFPLILLVLLISVIFFHTATIIVSPDSGWYVSKAMNIYLGRGNIDIYWQPETYRAPIFSGLIAFYFRLFSPSFTSAYWVVRTFFVGNLIISYLLGKELFNKLWGVFIFLFVLTAPPIYSISHKVLLDIVMPFFVLLACYWLVLAINKERWYYFILSGVSLGIAYLTKATAGVFFAIPILLIISNPAMRKQRILKYWFLFYFMLGFTIFPWYLYLYLNGANPFDDIIRGIELVFNPLKKQPGIHQKNNLTMSTIFAWPIQIINLLFKYYKIDFANELLLSPILLIAWGKIIYATLCVKRYRNMIILSGFLLYLTLAPIQANIDFGNRHSVILYIFSFFALVGSLWPGNWLHKGNKKTKDDHYIISIFIIIFFLAFQIFVGKHSWFRVVKVTPPVFSTNDYKNIMFDNYNSGKAIAEWFNDHSIIDPKIMVDESFGNYVYCFGINNKPFEDIPFVDSKRSDEVSNYDDWIALWNYQGFSNISQVRSRLIAVSEGELLKDIVEKEIEYFIVEEHTFSLLNYFHSHPDFALIYGPDKFGNSIFKIAEDVKPISEYSDHQFQFQVGEGTVVFLENLKHGKPDLYHTLKSEYLQRMLHFDDIQINAIEIGEYPLFNEKTSMSHLKYIQRIYILYGNDGVNKAIELQEEKLEWVRNKTSTKKLLVTLYLYTGNYSKAKQFIEEVLTETPEDIFAQNLSILSNYALDKNWPVEITIKKYDKFIEPAPYSLISKVDLYN